MWLIFSLILLEFLEGYDVFGEREGDYHGFA